jgi:hypothetical protein
MMILATIPTSRPMTIHDSTPISCLHELWFTVSLQFRPTDHCGTATKAGGVPDFLSNSPVAATCRRIKRFCLLLLGGYVIGAGKSNIGKGLIVDVGDRTTAVDIHPPIDDNAGPETRQKTADPALLQE